MRVTLFDLSRTEHFALLVVHHIVFDGWSMGVFSRELAELYRAFLRGGDSPLEEPELQYADYSDWHRQWLLEPSLRKQLDYWKAKLAGTLPVLQMPTDRARQASRTFHGATAAYTLPASLLRELKARAQEEGATLFMLLLAAFDALVHRYSGAEDVIVGTPIANRNRAELEGIIGFFVNTLALRTAVRGDDSLRDVIRAVRATTLEAYDHQDVPFDQIVEQLRLPRELGTSPVFQAMLVLHNQPTPEFQLPDLTVSPVEVDRRVATFDLVISLEEGARGLACSIEYSTEFFERATIDRLVAHWTKVLEAMVRHPEARVAEVDLLSEDERRHLFALSMPPASAFPAERCAHEWVGLTARSHPGAVAARHLGAELTYGELEARATLLARRLCRAGLRPDTAVPLCIERSLDMLVGMLGILKAGGAILPVDLGYPADRIAYMITQSRSPVIVTARRHEARSRPRPWGRSRACGSTKESRSAPARTSCSPRWTPGASPTCSTRPARRACPRAWR
ncbi:condensation domain-containing protein [Cystobacter fuscus]